MTIEIVPAEHVDAARLRAHVIEAWHAEFVVMHRERIRPADLPGVVALDGETIVGHASYRVIGDACELTSIVADPPGRGVGGQLLAAVETAAREAGCASVWLTTTNDNLTALRFYQRRGYRLVRLRPGAVDEARRSMKAEIPEVGASGVPVHDELDLERRL